MNKYHDRVKVSPAAEARPCHPQWTMTFLQHGLWILAASLVFPTGDILAANVEPAGYTNSFDLQPPAVDWATFSRTGTANDAYDMDSEVNATITASGVTAQSALDAANPPAANANATWSSSGFYLQIRPTGNRYTVLMGKFVNHTGTNATELSLAYAFTLAGGGVAEESTKGTRVYYSLTGLTNSWVNLATLNSTANSGTFNLSTNLSVVWTNGANLYLLWADDNASGNPTDSGDQIDNFTLQVTAGFPPTLTSILNAPTNNALYASDTVVTAAVTVINGTAPYSVQYFTNSGAGNVNFGLAGTLSAPPYSLSLGTLPAGVYNIHAVATDSDAIPATASSVTNTFYVANPIVFGLTAPSNGATFDNTTPIIGTVSLSGGTAPYAVQFYLDNTVNGLPETEAPYSHSFGAVPVGDHPIKAMVTDAKGWASTSAVTTVHITGPLAVILTPTNGASYNYGQPLVLTAVAGGGTAPYSVTFSTNGQAFGTLSAAPFSTNLGVLPVGSYTCLVHAVDSTVVPQQIDSSLNIITILPNPLTATLNSPTNNQNVATNAGFTIVVAATVLPPVTVSNVEFYVDGISTGVDSEPPYSLTVVNPSLGGHTVYAVVSDSLGRKASTATNQITAIIDPLANDNFANRFVLTGPKASATGVNVGATTETGEPTGSGFNTWGASLWWSWTAPASGTARMDTFGSSFNTELVVYTGTAVNALTQIAANDNAPGVANVSLVNFSAQEGTEYKIQVSGNRTFGPGGTFATGSIQLNVQMPPSVSLTAPTNNSLFIAGSNIFVTANATSQVGTVEKVDFYRRSILAGTATAAPYEMVLSDAPPGSNTLFAVVTDSFGQVATSAVVNVLVANWGTTLTSPQDGAVYLNTNALTVSAIGLLPAGVITNIAFYADDQLIGQDGTAPFSISWTNVTSGVHKLAALGTSDAGDLYPSTPIWIAISVPLVRSNSVWKYLDDGLDQGTNWIAPDFNDVAWASGPAPLGYGDSNGRLPQTTNAFGTNANNKFITTYYRQTFTATNLANLTNILLNIQRDDGAIVYLNGGELGRFNMPGGPVTYQTVASANANDDGTATFTSNLSPAKLIEGLNVLAVEIHQDTNNSSDIWFVMELAGIPTIIRNQSPLVALTNPTNNAYYFGPSSVQLEASASDNDGNVVKVEFYADGVKLGQATNTDSLYSFTWNNPPIGAHVLTAVATDNQGGIKVSAQVPIVVYDTDGRPVAKITRPTNGAIMEGPTNLLLTATANSPNTVTNVQFQANGLVISNLTASPYSLVWDAPFGTNLLTAVAFDANGLSGTSPVVSVVITIPPSNILAPTIITQVPPAFAVLTNFTSLRVVFSEPVQHVDAADLLINGNPAANVTGSGSNYVFTFPQPPYGEVEIAFVGGHGITDYGWPTVLPFNELSPDAAWEYGLIDRTAPTVAAHVPATGATVTNLAKISVTFNEIVTGVDAADLLVSGTPAFNLSGSGSNYVFDVIQPASGTVNITWATNHGILDTASNAFNRTGTGATWSFTLDARTTLVQSNSTWRFLKGLAEASDPTNAWRQLIFDDSGWSNGLAPFVYGEPNFTNALNPGTDVSDMASNAYSSVYLRKQFVVANAGAITNLLLSHQSDDGFIAWINGVEVFRYNVPAGEVPFNGGALTAATESGFNAGVPFILVTLTNGPAALVNGTNILAVHAFNVVTSPASSDFVFNAQLYTFLSDAAFAAPRVASVTPAAGDLFILTNLTINFSEGITNVDASDLLINGVPATGVSSATNTTYAFAFPQPPYGTVAITWATNHGIVDLDSPSKPFNGDAASAKPTYTLVNPIAPRVIAQIPAASATITGLTSVAITFNKPVTGVDAADLLIAGTPAFGLSGSGSNYTFTFSQPSYGTVAIRWATNHGIRDLEAPANDFDPSRPSNQWNYTLVNPVPAVTLTSPANNTYLLAPANVTVSAAATDNDGVIARVVFFADSNLLGERTNTPYSLTWSNVPAATYTLRAVASDNSGLMATSAPVVLNMVTSLPAVLTRGPYLQSASPTGLVVRWRTDISVNAVVAYGDSPANLTNLVTLATPATEHIVTVGGLQPDTKYYYTIGSSIQTLAGGPNADGTNFWFKTSPAPGTRRHVRFWALGDSGTANYGATQKQNQLSVRDAFYNFAATNGAPDLWLMLGDNAYISGTDAEHQTALFDIYPTTLRNLCLWPTIGNHETAQSFTATSFPYLDIFSNPQNGEAGGVPSGTKKYYSFDYANIHFICLDSMTSGRATNTAMAQWLISDLEAATAEWLIVYFHHPPYTKGSHNSDAETELIEMRQNLVPIFERYGVDLVLSGHSHSYERSYLLNGHYGFSTTLTDAMKIGPGDGREDGTGAYRKNDLGQGTSYTVCGSSGQTSGGSLNHPAHFISLNELGSLVIDVVSNRLEVKFLAATGVFRDHFTLIKPEPAAPPAPINLVAIAQNLTTVALSWIDTARDETSYIVERSLDGATFTPVLALGANATNALDTGLSPNTTYVYRVAAANAIGRSDYSNLASTTTVAPSAAPQAPSDLLAKADNGTEFYRSQIFLQWRDRSTNESGFLIERSLDGAAFTPIATVAAGLTHYLDRDLASATVYYYRVRSLNGANLSAIAGLAAESTHPQSIAASLLEAVTFHGGAEGQPPIAYQWRLDGQAIAGATNESYAIASVLPWDGGDYSVVITDAAGQRVSNPAFLYVISPPFILRNPQSRTNVLGTAAEFTVAVLGDEPIYYQWRWNGQPIPGGRSATFSIANVLPSHQGAFDVIVSNDYGAATSQVALLVVNTPPTAAPDTLYRPAGSGLSVYLATLLINDSDADGDAISIVGVSSNSANGAGVTFLINDGVIYTPPTNFNATDTFTYTLADSRGATSIGLVTVIPDATLRVAAIKQMSQTQLQLSLSVPANQSSALLYAPNLTTPWTVVTNYPAATTNRMIPFVAPTAGGSGYYFLRSP